jgi:hypothetical protein
MSPGGAGSESRNNKSSLLLSFKKEDSSFLKKRSKRLLFLCSNLTVRFRSEACFQVVSLISTGAQLQQKTFTSLAAVVCSIWLEKSGPAQRQKSFCFFFFRKRRVFLTPPAHE